jgi:hypothetical protein
MHWAQSNSCLTTAVAIASHYYGLHCVRMDVPHVVYFSLAVPAPVLLKGRL